MVEITFGSASHPGLVRKSNEDTAVAAGKLAIVADGMGGHAAGDLASQLAANRFADLATGDSPLRPNDLLRAVDGANSDILQAAAVDTSREGMGTTLAGLVIVSVGGSDHWMVFNVGDSRVYRLADHTLRQITTDHSEVQELVATGTLDSAQAKSYPRRNVVTRSLGTDPPPRADTWVFPPTPGERFLVCSDGLTNEIDHARIEAILVDQPDAQRAADALVTAAVAAGGHDNVTAVVVDLANPPRSDLEAVGDTSPRTQLGEGSR